MIKQFLCFHYCFLFTVENADEEDSDLQHFAPDPQSSVPVLFALQFIV